MACQEPFRLRSPRPFQVSSRKSLHSPNRDARNDVQGVVLPAVSSLARHMQFSPIPRPRGESISAESSGTEGGEPMRDWMAFVTAVVVALLTRMLLA